MTTCDVLAVGAHPDDVELIVGGTLLLAKELGFKTAICHMTRGEAGTRGTPETRAAEASAAATALGVDDLSFLGLPDTRLAVNDESIAAVVDVIRRLRPRVLLAPYIVDLHPDHEATGQVCRKAAFLAGVERYAPGRPPWRPQAVYYYMSHTEAEPRLIVDVTAHFEKKIAAAKCYRSQFHVPESSEPKTYISGPTFWHWWEGRHASWGNRIGVAYGEAFWIDGPIPARNPFTLFDGFGKYKNA